MVKLIEKSDYIDGIGAEIFSIEMLEQLMKIRTKD